MSNKSNIYLFNSLRSVEVEFNKAESLIISRLLDMDNRLAFESIDTTKNLSREFLNIFNLDSSNLWSQIDRVCISLRESASNQIYILSADQNENVPDNILINGYSCVVDENSSLMSLKDGEIRTYDDVENIINSFHSSGRKVQRSIGLIQHSNIQSGLTMPLCRDGKTFGFLFFNSTKLNAFKNLTSQDYSILCLAKLIAQKIVSGTAIKLLDNDMFEAIERRQNKNQLIESDLKNDLEKLCRDYLRRDFSFIVDAHLDEAILLPHRKYLNAVCMVLKNVHSVELVSSINLKLRITEDFKLKTEMTFNPSLESFKYNGFLGSKHESSILDFEVSNIGKGFCFSLKFEPVVDNLNYSVGL